MLYSKSTQGFYDKAIHGATTPKDAVEISASRHVELLQGQVLGKIIASDKNGFPILVDPPPPSKECIAEGILCQIRTIERDKQPRAVREAILNQKGAAERLAEIDFEIAGLREQLKS